MLSYNSPTGFFYYKGELNGNSVFIKWGKNGQAIKNEFQYANLLYKGNQKNFIKPIFYQLINSGGFIVFDYETGITLEDKMQDNSLGEREKNIIVSGLVKIGACLSEANCCHRDIRPANILISNNNNIILFDFQFANNIKGYKENKYIRRKPRIIYNLGGAYAKGKLVWNDASSLIKIVNQLDSLDASEILESSKSIKKLERVSTVKFKSRYINLIRIKICLLYTSPSPRDRQKSRMPSSA